MDALQQQAMANAQKSRRDREMVALERALDRIDSDDFGLCEECGGEIPIKRLELSPNVRVCVPCQTG